MSATEIPVVSAADPTAARPVMRSIFSTGDWQQRLVHIVDTVREMSAQSDAQEMVRAYARRMRDIMPLDGHVSLSRRDLRAPWYRITRSSRWSNDVNPWKQRDKLPLCEGGLLAELLYGNQPQIIQDLQLSSDDPAAAYLEGHRSLIAIPHYEGGEGVNMVVHLRKDAGAFDPEMFPEFVLMSNLFGRATYNLVLSGQLQEAYDALDRELRVVGDIQRSLLPAELPAIPGLDLGSYYSSSRRAGGDYYDFFPLPDGRWGILIADVSGHGTPAAVVMAITHSIGHTHPGPPTPPCLLLEFINRHLTERYTNSSGTFVTAFYGIYDPNRRELTYSSAGHNPPRLRRAGDGAIRSLDGARSMPLGISADEKYSQVTQSLSSGDLLLFYTDGITETFTMPPSPGVQRAMFGVDRLDAILRDHRGDAALLITDILTAVDTFAAGQPAEDDRTLLAMRVQ